MNTLAQANKYMREGKHVAAAEIYKNLLTSPEPIAGIAKGNLELISRKYKKNEADKSTAVVEKQIKTSTTPKKIYIQDLYNEIRDTLSQSNLPTIEKEPLVSIIVTAHNTSEYIEACLESLLNQTYQNREIFVIDDVSTDKTPDIIKRIAKSNKHVHYRRLNSNLGTYYAKNLGIKESKGEILFFQDSDDISHPQRIEILTKQILETNKLVIRGSYSRTDPDTDEVLSVNNLYKKLGLITLGVRREVFNRIGFFNCTTKASDDEFYNRIVKFIGKNEITNNELPLYYNTYRDNSLFADMVTRNADGSIEQKPSESRANYVENFKNIHDSSDIESIKRRFRFPKIRDGVRVYPDMTKLANPKDPVIVNVCSIPQREQAFQRTINSIIDQCDHINIYLDRYKKIPAFLDKYKDKCTITHSSDAPNLRDNGKFLALESLIQKGKPAYYFTIDDDIIYPVDYTNTLIKKIVDFNHSCAVGVHGVIMKDHPDGYFSDRRIVYNFTKQLEEPRCVNLLGTGTLAFHTSVLQKFTLSYFASAGMADIYFAVLCKLKGIPLVALARHEGWLVDMNPSPDETLYQEFSQNDLRQAELIKENAPWGLKSINSIIAKSPHITAESLKQFTIRLKSLTKK